MAITNLEKTAKSVSRRGLMAEVKFEGFGTVALAHMSAFETNVLGRKLTNYERVLCFGKLKQALNVVEVEQSLGSVEGIRL